MKDFYDVEWEGLIPRREKGENGKENKENAGRWRRNKRAKEGQTRKIFRY